MTNLKSITYKNGEKHTMKIAFCGTHSTGKTTLLNALKNAEEFKDFMFIEGITRMVNSAGLPINEATNDFAQISIVNYHAAYDLIYDSYITDRSVIDVLSYTKRAWLDNDLSFESMTHILKVALKIVSNYDIIFYLPNVIGLETDGTRSADLKFQARIDSIIKNYLNSFKLETGIDHITLNGTVEERVEQVLKSVKMIKER